MHKRFLVTVTTRPQDTSGTPQDWSQNVSISHHPKTEAEAGGRSGMPRPGSEISELGRGPWAGLRGRCSVYHIVVDRLLRHLNECHVNDFYPRLCAMVRTGHGTSKPSCHHSKQAKRNFPGQKHVNGLLLMSPLVSPLVPPRCPPLVSPLVPPRCPRWCPRWSLRVVLR